MGKDDFRPRRFPAFPLDRGQVEALLKACGGKYRRAARDRALIVCWWRGGLRCSEALDLKMEDVKREAGGIRLRVERPKGFARGTPPREVGLDPKASGFLEKWIEYRGEGPGLFFVTATGKRILPSQIRSWLPILARKAGLKRRVHAHAFRHTFARELYDEGVGIYETMMALGHANLTTTQTYLKHIGATPVVELTKRREW